MKKIMACGVLCALCGCSQSMVANYESTIDSGCRYSETYRSRRNLFDFFGVRDTDVVVNYIGVKCENIIKQELQDETHKKPYGSVQVVSELPQKVKIQ